MINGLVDLAIFIFRGGSSVFTGDLAISTAQKRGFCWLLVQICGHFRGF